MCGGMIGVVGRWKAAKASERCGPRSFPESRRAGTFMRVAGGSQLDGINILQICFASVFRERTERALSGAPNGKL